MVTYAVIPCFNWSYSTSILPAPIHDGAGHYYGAVVAVYCNSEQRGQQAVLFVYFAYIMNHGSGFIIEIVRKIVKS